MAAHPTVDEVYRWLDGHGAGAEEAFQDLVGALLEAEVRPPSRARAFHLPRGWPDRGYDAAIWGAFEGLEGQPIRVSVKASGWRHRANAKRARTQLLAALRDDIRAHAGDPAPVLFVVALELDIEWVERIRALPAKCRWSGTAGVLDIGRVADALARHPTVARVFGVVPGPAAFEPVRRARSAPGIAAPGDARPAAFDRTFSHTELALAERVLEEARRRGETRVRLLEVRCGERVRPAAVLRALEERLRAPEDIPPPHRGEDPGAAAKSTREKRVPRTPYPMRATAAAFESPEEALARELTGAGAPILLLCLAADAPNAAARLLAAFARTAHLPPGSTAVAVSPASQPPLAAALLLAADSAGRAAFRTLEAGPADRDEVVDLLRRLLDAAGIAHPDPFGLAQTWDFDPALLELLVRAHVLGLGEDPLLDAATARLGTHLRVLAPLAAASPVPREGPLLAWLLDEPDPRGAARLVARTLDEVPAGAWFRATKDAWEVVAPAQGRLLVQAWARRHPREFAVFVDALWRAPEEVGATAARALARVLVGLDREERRTRARAVLTTRDRRLTFCRVMAREGSPDADGQALALDVAGEILREPDGNAVSDGALDGILRWCPVHPEVLPRALPLLDQRVRALLRRGHRARAEELAKAMLGPGRLSRLVPEVRESLLRLAARVRRSPDEAGVLLGEAAVRTWLAGSVPWTAQQSEDTIAFGCRPWRSPPPEELRRAWRAAAQVLDALLSAEDRTARIAAWGLFRALGAHPGPPPEPERLPRPLVRVLRKAVRDALPRLRETDDLLERAEAEAALLGAAESPWASRALAEEVAAALTRDPVHHAFRLLTASPALREAPEAWLERLRAEGPHAAREYRLRSATAPSAGIVERAVDGLAERRAGAAELLRLLEAAAEDVLRLPPGRVPLLATWARRAPDTFRQVLEPDRWRRMPLRWRAELLRAVAPLFDDLPRERGIGGAAPSGPLLDLHHLLEDPASVEADEAVAIVAQMRTLLEPARLPAALYRAAAHPDLRVRAAVLKVFKGLWDERALHETDLHAALDRLLTPDEAGARLLDWSCLWRTCPDDLPEAIVVRLLDAFANHLEQGRWPGHFAARTLGPHLGQRLAASAPRRLWVLLAALDRAGHRVDLDAADRLVGGIEDVASILRLLEVAPLPAPRARWGWHAGRAFSRLAGELRARGPARFEETLRAWLDAGATERAASALAALPPRAEDAELLVRALARLESELALRLLESWWHDLGLHGIAVRGPFVASGEGSAAAPVSAGERARARAMLQAIRAGRVPNWLRARVEELVAPLSPLGEE